LVAQYLAVRLERIESPELLRWDALLPEAVTALRLLASRHRLVLVSLRRRHSDLQAQIAALGIAPCLAAVAACYRPCLPGWQSKAAAMSSDPGFRVDRAIAVGDTEDDILAARYLGIRSVAVLSGMRSRACLSALRPTTILDSLAEVPSWLAAEHALLAQTEFVQPGGG